MTKQDIQGGVILLIVILLIGGFFLFAKETPQLAYGPVEITGSVIVAKPTSNMNVDVSGAFIKDSFITIHQAMGEAPGEIIGISQLIKAGSTETFSIPLTKPMVYAGPYLALLHVDNSDGTFVVKDDMPVTSGGKTVRSDFTAPVVK